jgi:uncharacterized protein YPO0396
VANADDESDISRAGGFSIARARATVAGIERRAQQMFPAAAMTLAQLEDILTEASSVRLTLEAERLRAKRRRFAALHDAPTDREAQAAEDRLAQHERLLEDEIDRLRHLIDDLHALLGQLESERPD